MRCSNGILDWLFGEKVTIDLPTGQKRVVTKRWWAEMQRQGKVTPITAESADTTDGQMMDITPESIFKYGELIAMTALSSLKDRLPAFQRLIARDGLDNWAFCFTTAFAYTAIREQPAELSDQEFDDCCLAVHRFTPQWQPDGVGLFNNLNDFMDMSHDIPCHAALGMWVLWNLAGIRPTQDDEIQLAGVLGSFIETNVTEWWNLLVANYRPTNACTGGGEG